MNNPHGSSPKQTSLAPASSASSAKGSLAAADVLRKPSRRPSRKGIALISVLTVVTLATILVLTFFTLARNEMIASVNYSHGLHAKHLSETAVNMVIGQIRRATADTERVWASQPGAIRAYNGTSGVFEAGYKLYSSGKMVEKAAGPAGEAALVGDDFGKLATWDQELWRYADLNEPVIRKSGAKTRVYYPIVDPRARDYPTWDSAREFDDAGVEGFDWNTTGLGKSPMQDELEKIEDPLTGATLNTLPMPVEWMYQLEDGTLGYLNNSKEFTAFGGGGTATKDNPIIGRIAFWTDDETAKSNVNVHAGGTAWDTPRAGGDIDRDLGRYQPAQREWQRYPGHPATTSLAPVLFPGMKNITLNRDEMEKIFRMVPRVVGGGSSSGTRAVNPNDPKESNGLIPDKDRLYPSLDDFILRPGTDDGYEHVTPKIAYGERLENDFPLLSGGQDVDELLELGRFFLTVSSRAPEVNLFNQPRVSIWPTYYATNADERQFFQTPFDKVIRFCAQLGQKGGEPNRYYFQRRNEDSTTDDWDKIPRNQEVYAYLDRLTSRPVPGYGASFNDKFGKENRLQLLTQMFDFIRSTNLFDDTVYDHARPDVPLSWKAAYNLENKTDHLTFTNYRTKSERGLHMGHGQVTPIWIDYDGVETKGFGRFYTIEESGIMMICCADAGQGELIEPLGRGVGSLQNTVGIEEFVYSNVPPQAQDFIAAPEASLSPGNPEAPPGTKATWPNWYTKLYNDARSEPATGTAANSREAVIYANKEDNWNWMLARAKGYHSYDRSAFDTTAVNEMYLDPEEKLVQAMFLMEMFSPSAGWTAIQPDMMINVDFKGLKFDGVDGAVTFEDGGYSAEYQPSGSSGNLWVGNRTNFSNVWGGRNYGGGGGLRSLMRSTMSARPGLGDPVVKHRVYILSDGGADEPKDVDNDGKTDTHRTHHEGWNSGRRAWFDGRAMAGNLDATNIYPFITVPFRTPADNVPFTGDEVEISIYSNREKNPDKSKVAGSRNDSERLISAPKSEPQLVQTLTIDFSEFGGSMPAPVLSGGTRERLNEWEEIYARETSPMEWWSLSYDGVNPRTAARGRLSESHRTPGATGKIIRPADTCWSMAINHGDGRLTAGVREIPHSSSETKFERHPRAGGTNRFGHSFTLAQGGTHLSGTSGVTITDLKYPGGKRPLPIPSGDRDTYQLFGDFDNGMGGTIDGPYINKVDEGNTHSLRKRRVNQTPGSWEYRRDYGSYPYFVREWTHEPSGPAFFSPNRMMPSPVIFGSMPNMILNNASSPSKGAWQTLLFRPNIVGNGYTSHPGAESPPDHLLLDLFWMPIVEPYAVSEPSSTAGRVNMNYQILPFTNITRTAALRGVFQSEYMLCIPNYHVKNYKVGVGRGHGYHWLYRPFDGELQKRSLRSVIVEHETLEQFEEKFLKNELFLTTSEICDIHLIPQDIGEKQGFTNSIGTFKPSLEQMKNGRYMFFHKPVGDNSREAPYSHIYPRLTTKSNTFKVHIRSQVVKKARGTEPDVWDPEVDTVVAEYRGSALVERYVEPNDPEIPDYATATDPPTLDLFYKFRVVNEKRFSP